MENESRYNTVGQAFQMDAGMAEAPLGKPSTPGEKILHIAGTLLKEAEALEAMSAKRLHPIVRPDMKDVDDEAKETGKAVESPWPPYFDELRILLRGISASIRAIRRTIEHVDL